LYLDSYAFPTISKVCVGNTTEINLLKCEYLCNDATSLAESLLIFGSDMPSLHQFSGYNAGLNYSMTIMTSDRQRCLKGDAAMCLLFVALSIVRNPWFPRQVSVLHVAPTFPTIGSTALYTFRCMSSRSRIAFFRVSGLEPMSCFISQVEMDRTLLKALQLQEFGGGCSSGTYVVLHIISKELKSTR